MVNKMKLLKIVSIMVCLTMTGFFSEARAAFLSVAPTGPFDAQAAPSITYDIFFNVGPGENFSFIGWDLDLRYDAAELGNWTLANVLAGSIAPAAAPNTLNFLFLSLEPATDVNLSTPGSYQLASLGFDIIGPPQLFDSMADFAVLSQIGMGAKGFLTDQYQLVQLGGVAGADVGAVPIPGSVWLLGGGLAGLLGLRRKKE